MSIGEQACSLAALILYDDGILITAEKISMLVKSAKISMESYWATLIDKLLEKRSFEDLILSVGSGGGRVAVAVAAPGAGGTAAAQDAAPAPEEKKKEPKEGGKSSRVVNSILSLKSYNERQMGGVGFCKFGWNVTNIMQN